MRGDLAEFGKRKEQKEPQKEKNKSNQIKSKIIT